VLQNLKFIAHKYTHLVTFVGQFAGDWYVTAYLSTPSFNDLKCAKMSVDVFKGEAGTIMNYKLDYFGCGKAQIGEGISYSKEEGKGAATFFSLNTRANYTYSSKLNNF
jgi:hypothetical protein